MWERAFQAEGETCPEAGRKLEMSKDQGKPWAVVSGAGAAEHTLKILFSS